MYGPVRLLPILIDVEELVGLNGRVAELSAIGF
jgi:hypothetical protein